MVEALDSDDLITIVSAAINLYAESGLSAAQLESLGQVDVRIADLTGGRLGQTSGNVVTIDVNAAGYGWYVGREWRDESPEPDEFASGSEHSTLSSAWTC